MLLTETMAPDLASNHRSQTRDRSIPQDQAFTNVDPHASTPLARVDTHRQNFLPSSASLDTPPEQVRPGEDKNVGGDSGLLKYSFVSVAQALSEEQGHSRGSSLSPISRESTPQPDRADALLSYQETQISSQIPLNHLGSASVCRLNTEVPSAQPKPLLNLVWRDVGNGISRAYARQDLPPLLSSQLPENILIFEEGCQHPGNSNHNTIVPGVQVDSRHGTINSDDIRLKYAGAVYLPLSVVLKDWETSNTFALELAENNDSIPTTFREGPQYEFVALPGRTSIHEISVQCSKENDSIGTASTETIPLCPITDKETDNTTSNVQPTHLSPHTVDAQLSLPSREDYIANTSSGFSDEDSPSHEETQSIVRRLRYHQRRRHMRTTIKVRDGSQPNFTRIAVLHAAERLIKLRAGSYSQECA